MGLWYDGHSMGVGASMNIALVYGTMVTAWVFGLAST